MDSYWLILVLIVIIPLFFWLRVRTFNKRKEQLAARCPHCQFDQRISGLSNYICQKCGQEIRFFDEQGNALPEVKLYACAGCGAVNFVGILTCQGCGLSSSASIPG